MVKTIVGTPLFGDGKPFSTTTQYLSGLELNYKLNDALSLASTTGLYDGIVDIASTVNGADSTFAYNPAAGPAGASGLFVVYANLKIRENFAGTAAN